MSKVEITQEDIDAIVKQANTKFLKVVTDVIEATWEDVLRSVSELEYAAYLTGYLTAHDMMSIDVDCSKETNAKNI